MLAYAAARVAGRWLIVAVLLSTAPASAGQMPAGDPIATEGTERLRLTGQAHRRHLLGTVDLYEVALYRDAGTAPDALSSADAAKALHITVTWADDVHRRTAIEWRGELIPRLEPAAAAHLRASFLGVRHGDVIAIEYTPGRGTTIRLNKAVVVTGAEHSLMLAFLDHWLGDRPVSEEVKRTLLAGV
jgi:hypothetical protein